MNAIYQMDPAQRAWVWKLTLRGYGRGGSGITEWTAEYVAPTFDEACKVARINASERSSNHGRFSLIDIICAELVAAKAMEVRITTALGTHAPDA